MGYDARGRGRGGGRGGRGGGGRGGGMFNNRDKFAKKSKDQGRASKTNRAQDAKRFSTIKFPKKAEVKTANQRALAPELRAGGPSAAELASRQAIMKKPTTTITENDSQQQQQASSSSAPFDPIPQDPVFFLVENSKYWPPPPLKNANKNGEEDASGMGLMDQFDRQDDEKQKRKHAEKLAKQQKKENPGELVHPRGKAAVNLKVKLDSDSD